MTDTAPAPAAPAPALLPPDTPITIDNFAQALAQILPDGSLLTRESLAEAIADMMAKLPNVSDPSLKPGELAMTGGMLFLN